MNINTLNYVGLVKQAGLFSKLFNLGREPFNIRKVVIKPKSRYDNLPEGFQYEPDKLPRSTRFFDVDDDPYTPKDAYFKQPRPEAYATSHEYHEDVRNNRNPDMSAHDIWIDPHKPSWSTKLTTRDRETEKAMQFGTNAYHIKVFNQLMDKLNLSRAMRGVKTDAYDDPRLVEKMQRYADVIAREQGYGKYIK